MDLDPPHPPNATPPADDDPYDWTPAQVLAHLLPLLPPAIHAPLTDTLLSNDVDGETLLTLVTYDRLKTDLHLPSMGHRGRVLRAISALRLHSHKYHSPHPPPTTHEIQPLPALDPPRRHRRRKPPPVTLALTRLPSPTPPPPPSQPHSLPLGLSPPPPPPPPNPFNLLAAPAPVYVADAAPLLHTHTAVRLLRNPATGAIEAVPASAPHTLALEHPAHAPAPRADAWEASMRGATPESPTPQQQRKRKRGGEEPLPGVVVGDDDDVVVGDDGDVVVGDDGGAGGGRRSVCAGEKEKDKGRGRGRGRTRFLPPRGTPVDRLIYGNVAVGADVPVVEEEDGNFVIVRNPTAPRGHQLYVERQIRYLLRSAENSETTHNGHVRRAIKPYRPSLVLKHHHQSITVFTAQPDGSCKVTKETTATVSLPWDEAPQESQSASDVQMVRFATDKRDALAAAENGAGDWDYLLKWQGVDNDRELPTLGDSGSEGEYSLETWEQLTSENGGAPLGRPLGRSNQVALSEEEILEVLNEGEQAVINSWRKRELPRRKARAWQIYRWAKKRRERKRMARDARGYIKEMTERLDTMKAEIVGVGWTQRALVKKQVKIMEPTIADRELNKWILGLMERKEAPPRPEKVARKKTVAQDAQDGDVEMADGNDDTADDEDGESLGSTTDAYSDNGEDLGGFIVDDNVKDMVNGVAVEVEGETEVLEELARKAAEAEIIDSEESGSDSPPPRPSRRAGEVRLFSQEEGQVIGDDADAQMGGMGDEDSAEEDEMEKGAKTLDKGKERVVPDSATDPDSAPSDSDHAMIKAEPRSTQKPQSAVPTPLKNDITIIDLTGDDDSPPKQSPWKARLEKRRRLGLPQTLDDDNDDTGRAAESQELVERLVRETEQHERSAMWYRLEQFTPSESFESVVGVAKQLHRTKFKDVPGLDEYNAQIFRMIATIYVAWALGITDTSQTLKEDEVARLADKDKFCKYMGLLRDTLAPHCLERGITPLAPSPPPPAVPKEKRRRKSGVGRTADLNDVQVVPYLSTGLKKLKPVEENINSKEQRERLIRKEKQRLDRERAARKRNAGMPRDPKKIPVNLGKYAKDNDILLDDAFTDYLKKHQIDGILFMWQQLIQAGQNRGALLAHTMGLGKTLQVITLLHTIATAAASDDKKTYEQIPEHLRESKTLILSPPGLVDNWWDEFYRWLPTSPSDPKKVDFSHIGQIWRADSIVTPPEKRVDNIRSWYKNGGVLLLGYQSFRNFILNSPPYPEETHQQIKMMLLDGPNIIIADEAHQLKNQNTKISDAARGFRSMSRIAMTGSPLSNNLIEYWSMIEWIDPGFLGAKREFEGKYVAPIVAGLYADSSHGDKRRCLKMLRVLKKDIGPKVHRMDISAIEQELPGKTEFLIKVPLTELQWQMYTNFVNDPTTTGQMPGEGAAKLGRKFFDAVHLLALICNHPLSFVETLDTRESKNQALVPVKPPTPPSASDDEASVIDVDDMDDDVNDLLSAINKPYPWARALMNTVKDPMAVEHSHKMYLLKVIIDNAIEAKDKTLIFTHSTLTLAFLEKILKSWGVSFIKIDGKTPMGSRQRLTKQFNEKDIQVGLISTEAGGLGLNLPGANRVIIFDFKWSPMWEEQAIGRAYRIGQKKHVFVYRFHASGTFEEIVRNTVLFKNQLQIRVVDQQDPIRNATRCAKAYFKDPYTVPKEDISGFRGKDPLVLDKIIAQVDCILAIENTETFQDIEDTLTEEEIRESDQLFQAEQEQRNKLLDDNARKADVEYRKADLGAGIISPNPLNETDMQIQQEQKQREQQLRQEQERREEQLQQEKEEERLRQEERERLKREKQQEEQARTLLENQARELVRARTLATLNRTPLPSPGPTAQHPVTAPRSRAPPPTPGPNELVASLPPTTAGRTKSLSVPNTPAPVPKTTQKERLGSSPPAPTSKGRVSHKGSDLRTVPAPISVPAKANQTAKRVTPSTIPTASSAQKIPPASEVSPALGERTNKFKLNLTNLPKIFGDKPRRTPTNKPNE